MALFETLTDLRIHNRSEAEGTKETPWQDSWQTTTTPPLGIECHTRHFDFFYPVYPRISLRLNIITQSFHHHSTFTHGCAHVHVTLHSSLFPDHTINSPTAKHYFEVIGYSHQITV